MQGSNDERPTPPSHFAAILVAALIVGLLFFVGGSGDEDSSPLDGGLADVGRLPVFHEADRGGRSGRLALLEDYVVSGSGLDAFVTDRLFEPQLRSMEDYGSPLNYQAASAYLGAISEYKSAYDLKSFGDAAKHLAMSQPDPADRQRAQIVQKFTEVPGGRHILEGLNNPRLLMEFNRLTMEQTEKLKAREAITRFANVYRNEWKWSDGPVAGSTNEFVMVPEDEMVRRMLRIWELEGLRYFLSYCGNSSVTRRVEGLYPGDLRPVYLNGLNAVLDPVHRRFQVAGAFWPNNNPNATNNPTEFSTMLAGNPDGPIALAEFAGALPQVRLYADWETEADPDAARETLLSPGFNPQQRVLVRTGSLPEPEEPAANASLPAVESSVAEDGSLVVRIPPTRHAVVLLLNEELDPERAVTLDGAPASLLPANLAAGALHLPAAGQDRTLMLAAVPVAGGGSPLRLVGVIVVVMVLVFVIQSRRRTPAGN